MALTTAPGVKSAAPGLSSPAVPVYDGARQEHMMDIQAVKRGRWAVAALFFVNGFITGAWAPQIPLLLPRHQITEFTLGLLILLIGLGAVAAMMFAGKLIAAYGSRQMALLFGTLVAPMLPLVVLSPNLYLLAPCLILMGATLGCMDVSMNANAVEVEQRLGRAIMSSSHGFWSLGGFAGGGIGGLALARFGAVEQALGVSVISFSVLIIAARFLWREPTARVDGTAKPKTAMFPKVPMLYVLGGMALFSMASEGSVLDWAALYVSKTLEAPLERSGLAFALFAGTMAVMRFLGDSVRNRFGAVRTLRVSGLIAAAGIFVAALAPTDIVAIAGFAFAGLGVANMVPILFSAAGNHPGTTAGSGIATVTMIGYCGILLAPSVIGYAAETIGYRATYLTIVGLLIVVVLMARQAVHADGRPTVAVELPLEGGV
jgi:MFS family permease